MSGLLKTILLGALAGVLMYSTPAFAVRAEFITTFEGVRVAGAEICFFRAGDGPHPREIYLASREVRCLAADDVLDLPKGRWAYFARHASGLVGYDASVSTVLGENPSVDDYGTIEVSMGRAATVDLSAIRQPAEDWLALYVSNDNARAFPMLAPIHRGAASVMVPVGATVQLLMMRNERIVSVSRPIRATSAAPVAPVFVENVDSGATVITWVVFSESARIAGTDWAALPPPTVRLTHGVTAWEPEVPLRPGYGADGAMVVFRNVPRGAATVTVSGDVWVASEQKAEVTGGQALNLPVLETAPAAAVDVRWTSGPAPPLSADDCAGPAVEPLKAPTGFLYTCPGVTAQTRPEDVALSQCRRAATPVTTDAARRALSFRGVPPGAYILGLRDASFPAQFRTVALSAGERTVVDLHLETFDVRGTLKFDGKPLRARLEFATGTAASDATGAYYGALAKPPRDLPIKIVDCSDGTLLHTHLPGAPLRVNEPYDIDVARTRLDISVVDSASSVPIAGAAVEVGVLVGASGGGHFVGGPLTTARNGNVTALNVPGGQRVLVCARSNAHERACAPELQFGTEGAVTVRLQRKGQWSGRLYAAPQPKVAWLFVVGPQGTVLESVRLAPDGTFQLRTPHHAPSYVVVASSLPLFVMPLGAAPDGFLEVRPPQAPVRRIEIRRPGAARESSTLIGLYVSGAYIPEQALLWHQTLRGLGTDLAGAGPLLIPDVHATGPLAVTLGPSVVEMPKDLPAGSDIFTIPMHAAHFPRKPVPGDGKVSF